MSDSPFQNQTPSILDNQRLRIPQRESYSALIEFSKDDEREAGIVLPVGCGKSGCIALAPFAFKSKRTLVIAPGVDIAQQLYNDYFDLSNTDIFYRKCSVLLSNTLPEPAEIRGKNTNMSDLNESDVVITNIDQLQGQENKWLKNLNDDFFDLILFDEGHHSVAESWTVLKEKFPKAKIVNYSATPLRSDGQLMAGKIIYSFPVFRAIEEGYVKRLKAVVLNPKTLKYLHNEDGEEIELTLEEVKRRGETDAGFRRSVVTSPETRDTIVDASINELNKLRQETGEKNLKIIAAALNYDECANIVGAYRARGLRADYVHTRQDSKANKIVLGKLNNNELDVIVQVRKLGEGFDHPLLSVAAVFNVFANLSPFVQFVGRIMRVIKQNDTNHPLNRGVVVFHAGSNVANRWQDFQHFSEADQEFFDQLLPTENLDFSSSDELELEPSERGSHNIPTVDIKSQSDVEIEEIPLIAEDTEAMAALNILLEKGFTSAQIAEEARKLERIPVSKQRQRQAGKSTLDIKIRNAAGRILGEKNIKPEGKDLDKQYLGRTNFVIIKSAIDKKINSHVGRKSNERGEFTNQQLQEIESNFDDLVNAAIQEVFK